MIVRRGSTHPVVRQLLQSRVHERRGRAHLPEDARQLVALAGASKQGSSRGHLGEDAPADAEKGKGSNRGESERGLRPRRLVRERRVRV